MYRNQVLFFVVALWAAIGVTGSPSAMERALLVPLMPATVAHHYLSGEQTARAAMLRTMVYTLRCAQGGIGLEQRGIAGGYRATQTVYDAAQAIRHAYTAWLLWTDAPHDGQETVPLEQQNEYDVPDTTEEPETESATLRHMMAILFPVAEAVSAWLLASEEVTPQQSLVLRGTMHAHTHCR